MHALFVYGTLRPGQVNAHLLEEIGGEWREGYVTGTYYPRAWGAAANYPGVVLNDSADTVEGYLFLSSHLDAHWQELDEFEAGYDRVMTNVMTVDGEVVKAWIYQVQPRE